MLDDNLMPLGPLPDSRRVILEEKRIKNWFLTAAVFFFLFFIHFSNKNKTLRYRSVTAIDSFSSFLCLAVTSLCHVIQAKGMLEVKRLAVELRV